MSNHSEGRRESIPSANPPIHRSRFLWACHRAAIIFSDLLLPLTPMGLEFGHGIVPETCMEKVLDVVKWVKEFHSNKEKVIR